jgi:hypothetical protein
MPIRPEWTHQLYGSHSCDQNQRKPKARVVEPFDAQGLGVYQRVPGDLVGMDRLEVNQQLGPAVEMKGASVSV